jgi:hypothetical protein
VRRSLAWCLVGGAAALNAFGYALSLYELAWFDELAHLFTLFAITAWLAALMRGALPGVWRPASYVAVLVALGVALGTAWETAEWIYDAFSASNSIGGKADTMTDLIAGAAGAALAAAIALAIERRTVKVFQAPL